MFPASYTITEAFRLHMQDALASLRRRDYDDARRCLRWALRHANKLSPDHRRLTMRAAAYARLAQAQRS